MTMLPKCHLTRHVGSCNISYHCGKSDGHRYCGSADIRFLNLSCDHTIKRSREFEGAIPPLQVTNLPSLVAIGIVEGQI